jgi:hypothetical protein
MQQSISSYLPLFFSLWFESSRKAMYDTPAALALRQKKPPPSLSTETGDSKMDALCQPGLLCPTLCVGTTLSAIDFYFDLSFVVSGDSRPLLRYYNWVLNPSWQPVPWPGFFAVACVFTPQLTFCLRSNLIIAGMYIFYLPVCVRYFGIIKRNDGLRMWWTIAVLRIILFFFGIAGLASEGCAELLPTSM